MSNGLAFECDQDWEAMRPTASGRQCAQCDHAVVDFTRWERQAMLEHLRANPGTCGLYTTEQVEPGLVAIPELSGQLLRGAFAALAALTLHTAQAQPNAPTPAPTEQQPVVQPGPRVETRAEKDPGAKCWMEEPAEEAAPVRQHRHSKYYVSGRFPFVHKRRPRRMGRMVRDL